MWFRTLFHSPKSRGSRTPARGTPRQPESSRLRLEALDDRCLPSTFTVTNLLDGRPDSLRAAVAAANANPGADAIDFAVTGTIALTSGQLDLTDSLTINGPGASALTVSGEWVSRVFGIAGDPTVVIAGLTVANGWTSDSPGGGISMTGGSLTLDHVTLTGNSAVGQSNTYYQSGYGAGGGLYVVGGAVYVNQSTVSGNLAGGASGRNGSMGGGGGGLGVGGGVYIAGGMVYVSQSTVSSNGAYGGAGGFAYGSGDFFYGGNGGAAAGGGIHVAGGTLQVRQSIIADNGAIGGDPGDSGAGPDYSGAPGVSYGGGLYIATGEPLIADLDTFTVSNAINNVADIDPNISGSYFLDGSRLTIGDVTVLEGNDGTTAFVFTVTRSGPIGQAVSVDYATADGTATSGGDYTAASGTLTIPAGQTTGTITVQVNGDRLAEPNETFFINLSSPTGAVIADGTGVGTVVNDEPRIRVGDATVTEGNTGTVNATFTVTLSSAADAEITVLYGTANGTAAAGSDYQAASGTLTFAPGETSKTVTVLVNGDQSFEPNETFTLNLGSPTGAVIADGTGVGTVVNDDNSLPRVSIGDVTVKEGRNGNTFLVFTVTLSAPSATQVKVSYATADGTARAGEDYEAASGTLTFAPGETTKTVVIKVKGDQKTEADETFSVNLFGVSGALLPDSQGLGTILNDD